MKKLIICLTALIAFGQAEAQMRESGDWKDKIFIGGNVGATFGTVTNIQISPMIGYKFTDKTIGGITLTYQYYRQELSGGLEYKTNIYGGGLFARQYLLNESLDFIDNIFLHAEYEGLNYDPYDINNDNDREWVFTGLVGGGIQMGYLSMTALYVLNQSSNSPYGQSPLILRVGFGIF